MQGSFPLAAAPVRRASPSSPELDRGRGAARASQRLLDERIIRQVTPIFDTRALGYSSMLVAAKVDPEHPHRAAKMINAHPGVSHNYLRNHEFNLWFTIADEPDSALGLDGTLEVLARETGRRVDPPAPDAEALQDPHGPRDGGRHEGARAPRPRRPRRSSSSRQPYDELDIAVIRATQGDLPVVAEPYAAAAAELGIARRRAARRTWPAMQERGLLRRVAAILFHRRAGFSANGMGVWKVPEDRILEVGRADGRLPRHLALLPAPDLRRLALLGLHDGPRPLQGGVRRDPRRDRRRTPGIDGARDAVLLDRVQEDPAALLHRRLQARGRRSTRPSRRTAPASPQP